ncbi:MAG: ribonuclease HI [Alphaproteobacteria bacterium]|nr:ribonuclease HI [Alphaproteobacteria bacterium]
MVNIFTDGACSKNPGPGGWGARIEHANNAEEIYGGEFGTTNNRMELTAAIEALKALPDGTDITLTTDSIYVKDGITQWIKGWKARGWKTASKKPVKNIDLWQALDAQCTRHTIQWQWVRGHDGHEGNERADELARLGMAPYLI